MSTTTIISIIQVDHSKKDKASKLLHNSYLTMTNSHFVEPEWAMKLLTLPTEKKLIIYGITAAARHIFLNFSWHTLKCELYF